MQVTVIMEPLTATVLVTLFLTKTVEKLGEQMGEKLPELTKNTLEKIEKLKKLLWHKAPDTASAIERVNNLPELVEQQPQEYSLKALEAKIESATKAHPEIAEVVDAIATEYLPQIPQTVKQKMANGILLRGNFKAGDMTQKSKPGSSIDQEMLTDMKAGGDITVGNLTQE